MVSYWFLKAVKECDRAPRLFVFGGEEAIIRDDDDDDDDALLYSEGSYTFSSTFLVQERDPSSRSLGRVNPFRWMNDCLRIDLVGEV